MDYISHYKSPLGDITLGSDGEKLTGLWFDNGRYFGYCLGEKYTEKELPVFELTKQWLDQYFAGKQPDISVPFHFIGTDFQKEVWNILCTIPYGQTMTYGEIANLLAAKKGLPKMSARAVGGAVGHNNISILVPCHRVVGAGGNLTGFGGGIDRKIGLLTLEGIDMSKFYVPKRGTAL